MPITNFTRPGAISSTVWMAPATTEASRVNGLVTAGTCDWRPAQDGKHVARQQLAVEDPGAVEAGGLDVLDKPRELGHRCCAGNTQVNADGLAHITAMVIFGESYVKPGMR